MTVAEARNKGGVGTAGNEVVIRRDAGEGPGQEPSPASKPELKPGLSDQAERPFQNRGRSRVALPPWPLALWPRCARCRRLSRHGRTTCRRAVSLPVTAKRTSLAARSSSPTGQWVTVHSYQWGNHYQNAQYKLSPTPNPDGSVHVTVATTLWSTDGTIVKWTSTKTIYDNACRWPSSARTTGPARKWSSSRSST